MIDIQYHRDFKNVDRLATSPKLREYNLLEHSYMVTVLFKHFAEMENINYDLDVLDVVMNHDILEAVTGDLPYHIKNMSDVTKHNWQNIEREAVGKHVQLRQYTDERMKKRMNDLQHSLFKVCDLVDLWIFLKEEEALGNRSSRVKNIIKKCEELVRGKFGSIDKYMDNYKF